LLCSAVSLAIYGLGAYVLSGWHPWLALPYLLYCLVLEIRVLRKSCVHCSYYGKTCGFGKGRLCALFFQRGDPASFAARQATWVDVVPDLLVSFIPLVGGIVLLIVRFHWPRLAALIVLIGLATAGTGMVRGSLACKHCVQRTLGCPAQKLFEQRGQPE
jgi:hypothetical protein